MTGRAGRSCSPQPPTSAPLRDGEGSYGVPFPPPRTPKMHPAGTVQGNRLQRGLFLYKSIQNTVLSPPLPPRCDPTGTPPPPAATAEGETEARGCHPMGLSVQTLLNGS